LHHRFLCGVALAILTSFIIYKTVFGNVFAHRYLCASTHRSTFFFFVKPEFQFFTKNQIEEKALWGSASSSRGEQGRFFLPKLPNPLAKPAEGW